MSTLAVNAITNAAGSNTAQINGMTPTSESLQGFRNRIINGDMRISQRGTVTVNPGGSGNAYTAADRWSITDFFGTTGQLVTTIDTDVPAGQGFTSSLLVSCTTTLSMNFGQMRVRQRIEGFNASDVFSSDVTVSFWVKSSVAGQYTMQIANAAWDRNYSVAVTIAAANTWEKKTVTVPLAQGTASGTWNTSNETGLQFIFILNTSTATGVAETWGSNNGVLAGQAAWGTAGHTFRITGVQLEAGSVATPFERRPYGTELALCQRYYQARTNISFLAYAATTLAAATNFAFLVTMRAAPTVTLTNGTLINVANVFLGTATPSGFGLGIGPNSSGMVGWGASDTGAYTAAIEL